MICHGRCHDGTCYWCDMSPTERKLERENESIANFARAENNYMESYRQQQIKQAAKFHGISEDAAKRLLMSSII